MYTHDRDSRLCQRPIKRRRFAGYWRVIYPGSALIRRMWLRAIIRTPLFTDEQLADYVMDCNRKGAAVTMNIGVYQDGTPSPETLKQLETVRKRVRGS